jgi:hypothetical protein
MAWIYLEKNEHTIKSLDKKKENEEIKSIKT